MSFSLTFLTFFPLLGAVIIPFLPKSKTTWPRWVALFTSLPPVWVAWRLFCLFDRSQAGMQFMEGPFAWIPSYNIEYFMGIDGLSITMVLLTTIITPICILASWNIQKAVRGYFSLFLLLITGMMGVFVALDWFLFYIFWEIMLLPMYFLIGIWGGPRREYAAIKFFLYTLLGSVLMLLVMLAFYFYSDGNSFNLLVLADQAKHIGPLQSEGFRIACWFGLFICFAVKIPAFPFHTWLPDAHVEAPTAISVILAGVLLKMGIYGILRFNYLLFPDITADFAWMLAGLGVVNILYGALCAMAQTDFKKLIAYSSISHMGFCLLGMSSFTTEGINGAVLQMFTHGVITAQLFLIVGIIYDRAHHRDLAGFGGLATTMPRYAVFSGIAFFAALGLPGFAGFIAEILVFLGAFKVWRVMTIISVSGVVLTAAYMLWTYQKVFLGKVNEKYKDFKDISVREMITLLPLVAITVAVGVYPKPVLELINSSLVALNEIVKPFL
jgi:NADH-quinone oxidoreductase subunit M